MFGENELHRLADELPLLLASSLLKTLNAAKSASGIRPRHGRGRSFRLLAEPGRASASEYLVQHSLAVISDEVVKGRLETIFVESHPDAH